MAEYTDEDIQDLMDTLDEQKQLAQNQQIPQVDQEGNPELVAQQPAPAGGFVHWDTYKNDPKFVDLDRNQKQALFNDWQKYATNYLSQTGNLKTDEDIKFTEDTFTKLAEENSLSAPRFKPPNYAEQIIDQGMSGVRSMQTGVAAYGALLGEADPSIAAQRIADNNRKAQEQYVNPTMKAYGEKQLGFWESAGQIISHPWDLMLPMFAQSIGSNLPSMAASFGLGAATGGEVAAATAATGVGAELAPVTGIGTAIMTGLGSEAVLGGVTDALVTLDQSLNDELKARKLDPTNPDHVQSVLQDTDFQKKALAYSAGRGVAITATELATLGLGELVKTPVEVLAKQGMKGAAKEFAKEAGLQFLGEPAGEALAQATAQVATGQEVKLSGKDIAEEAFAGMPGNVVQGGLQAASHLMDNKAPETASEVTKQAVEQFAGEKFNQILKEGATDAGLEMYYNILSTSDKSRVLGVEVGTPLTNEQGTFAGLSPEEKEKVRQDFETTRLQATGSTTPSVTQAEQEVEAAFTPPATTETKPSEVSPQAQEELDKSAPSTAAVVKSEETKAPVPAKLEEAPKEKENIVRNIQAPQPAKVSIPLTQSQKSIARLVARAVKGLLQVDLHPDTYGRIANLIVNNNPNLTVSGISKAVSDFLTQNNIPTSPSSTFTGRSITPEARQALINQYVQAGYSQQEAENAAKYYEGDFYDKQNQIESQIFSAIDQQEQQIAQGKPAPKVVAKPAVVPAPALPIAGIPPVAPAKKRLAPTKKQSEALGKLGYLPADIEGLDRTQAKDIIAKQTPKVPVEKATQVKAEVPSTGQPGVTPPRPALGEVNKPVAPATTEQTTKQAEQKRLDTAEQIFKKRLGQIAAEGGQFTVDEESLKEYLGPNPTEQDILRVRATIRLLNYALADVKKNILEQGKGKGRKVDQLQLMLNKIKFTREEFGAGLATNPRDVRNLDVLYVNPERLISRLQKGLTASPADFFVQVVGEEAMHAEHGNAAFNLFLNITPEGEATDENYIKFYDAQNEEIEQSLSLDDIVKTLKGYSAIDTRGKTKQQLIDEFNQRYGRKGRLAEEYIRALIQKKLLNYTTEEAVTGTVTSPVMRTLGMIKDWLSDFVGSGTLRKEQKTIIDKYYDAVTSTIYDNPMRKVREARDEKNTVIPGNKVLSASTDPRERIKAKAQVITTDDLVKKIQDDFSQKDSEGNHTGEIWKKSIGGLIRSFPTMKSTDIESIVSVPITRAINTFDGSKGQTLSTYLFMVGRNAIIKAKDKIYKERVARGEIEEAPAKRTKTELEQKQVKQEAKEEAEFKAQQDKADQEESDAPAATEEEIASEMSDLEPQDNRATPENVEEKVNAKYAELGKLLEEDQEGVEALGPTKGGVPPIEAVPSEYLPVEAGMQRVDVQKVNDEIKVGLNSAEQAALDVFASLSPKEKPSVRNKAIKAFEKEFGPYEPTLATALKKMRLGYEARGLTSADLARTASVDPVELAKRKAVRSSITKLSDKYKFPVAFVTSDQMTAEIPRFASAMSKLQGLKLQPEPFVFNFLHTFENKVDWNKVKTFDQLVAVANDLYEAQKVSPVNELTINDIDWSRVETDLSSSVVASPEAGLVLAEYNRDPGEAGQKVVVDYINQKRMESVNEWAKFLENNEPNPFMRVLAWSIPSTALRENKIGRSTVALHPGAYTTLRQNLEDGGIKPINFEKTYRKIMADIAKRDLKDTIFVSPKEQWVYIPSKKEDPINFNANVNKLKYLSAITWCTSANMAEPYLSEGGFWVFLRDNIGTIAIKKIGDRVAEIQGPANLNQIQSMSDELLEKLTKFADIRPELRDDIDEKISEADRMTKEEIEQILQEGPADKSSSYFVGKIASQGAMTLDQKTRALQYAIGIMAKELKRATFPENVAEIVTLVLQDAYRIAATIPNGPEADALMPMLIDQLYETLLDPKVVEAFKNAKFNLKGSRFLPLVLSRILDSTKIDPSRKSVFVDLLIGMYNFTPVLSSPVYMKSREDALAFIKDSLDPVLEKGVELPIEERRKNQDIIKAVLKNPLLTKEDIAQTLDTIRAKVETLANQSKKLSDELGENTAKQSALYKMAQKSILDSENRYLSSFYWDLVLNLLQNREGIGPSTPPENFFIPRKDRTKWSKAIRIGYFDKYVLPLQNSDLFKNSFVYDNKSFGSPKYRIIDYAEALKDLGDRTVKFVEDVTTDYITFIPEDRPGDKDISSFVEDVADKLGIQNTSTFFAPVMKKALLRVASGYDRTKEIMPKNVRDWITRNISVLANKNWTSLLTSVVKLFRDSVVVASQSKEMNDLSTQQQLYTSPDTIGEMADLDLSYLKRYMTVLVDALMHNPAQAPNIELALKDFIETLLIAKPKVNPIDVLNSFIRTDSANRIGSKSNMTRNDYLRNTIYKYNLLPAILKSRVDVLDSLPPFSKENGYLGTTVSDSVMGVKNMLKLNEPIPNELYDLISTAGRNISKYVYDMPSEYWGDISIGLDNNTYLMGIAAADPNISDENLKKIVFSSEYLRNPRVITFTRAIKSEFYAGLGAYVGRPNSTSKERKQMAEHLKSLPERLKQFGVSDILRPAADDYAYLVEKLDADLIPSLSLDSAIVGTEAYYDTSANQLVFVEDNIKNVSRGEQLFYHESTHGNIAFLQTTESGRNELNQILSSARTELMARSDYLAQKSGFDSFEQMKLAYSFRNDSEMLGELLARYSEDLAESAPPSWFSQLINNLIGWFKRNLGLDFNRTDLLNWLSGRMQSAAQGERLIAGTQEPTPVLPSLTKGAFTASVDPLERLETQALRRALLGLDQLFPEVAKLLRTRTYVPVENAVLMNEAQNFVDTWATDGNPMTAKRKMEAMLRDNKNALSRAQQNAILVAVGTRLKNATDALDRQIGKEGNSPEKAALRLKLGEDYYEVFAAGQEINSLSGQDLQSANLWGALASPEVAVKAYTKSIAEEQKTKLAMNAEVKRLKAEIIALKDQLAKQAIDNATKKVPVPRGIGNVYDFLSAFGDLEPLDGENFQDYLNRIGVPYEDLMSALESKITASVDPIKKTSPVPANIKSMPANEAIAILLGMDKNLFGKLVGIRLKNGRVATTEEVARAQQAKRTSKVGRAKQANMLQMVFDFFNSTESEKPATEEPIEKDTLPVMVRLAKYSADAVTARVLNALGMEKGKTPKGLFDRIELQVRKIVNDQFRNETDPQNVTADDVRTPEERMLAIVERLSLAEDIFNQTKAQLKIRLEQDNRLRQANAEGQLNPTERAALETAIAKTFDANKIKATETLARSLIDFKAEARKTMSMRGATVGSLAKTIMDKIPGVTEQQANSLAKLIAANYDQMVKDSAGKQLARLTSKLETKGKTVPKTELQKMLELVNLGAFDEEVFYNALAERYDLPSWDPAIASEIKKRAEEIQRLPEGSDQRSTKGLDLQAYIVKQILDQERGNKKNRYFANVISSLWKAGALSGPGTHIVNFYGTNLNVALELFSEAVGYYSSLPPEAKRNTSPMAFFIDAFGQFFSAIGKGAEQGLDAFHTSYGRFRSETQKGTPILESFKVDLNKPWKLSNYVAMWKLVGRAMAAADTFNSVLANEAKLKMQVRYTLLKSGLSQAETNARVQELFKSEGSVEKKVQEQVDAEDRAGQFGTLDGLTPGSIQYGVAKRSIEAGKNRRFEQLREQEINKAADLSEEEIEGIRHFTAVSTFNSQPTGLIGFIAEKIAAAAAQVPLLTPFGSFTRTVANIVNSGINYTPYGFARMHGFSIGNLFLYDSKYNFDKPDAKDYYKLATQATLGTAVLVAVASLIFKYIDDPWDEAGFAVTGLGPTNKAQRDQLRASGWAPNTVRFKGPFGPVQFRHSDIPGFSLIFGAMGMMSDSIRYGTLNPEDKMQLAAYTAMSMGNVVFEKNLLSGAKSLFDILSLKEDPTKFLQRAAQSYTGGITNPGILRWGADTFKMNENGMITKIDYKNLQSSFWGNLMALTPIAVFAGKPMLNRLGEPVEEYPWAATTKRVGFVPEVKIHPVFAPLNGAGLFVPGVSNLTKVKVYEKGKLDQRRMTAEEYYDYAKFNGDYLKRILTPSRAQQLANLAKANREMAQDELQKMATASKQYALDRIEAQIRLGRKR
jgi:hypothetical protein